MQRRLPTARTIAPICCLLFALYACSQRPALAADAATVQKTSAFIATVTHFEASVGTTSNYVKVVNATLHLQNITAKPLILGYVAGSGTVIDDQGNHYGIGRDFHPRGIGEISGNNVSTDFALKPGEGRDMMLQFSWMPRRNDIYGTRYTLNMTMREIAPVGDKQYKIGAEYPLEFESLANGTWAPVAAPPPAPASPAPASPVLTGENVVNEGPFSAQVTELRASKSMSGNNPKHVLTATVQFKNTSDAPIILVYESESAFFLDNLGNRYDRGSETGHTASGIGSTTRSGIDASFTLQPGETKTAKFELWRYISRKTAEIGDHDTLYLAVQEVEILPSSQVREVRQYNLTFPGLAVGGGSGAAASKIDAAAAVLNGLFGGKKKR